MIQHLYREIVKFASKSWDLASLLVNSLLSYPGIYPKVYIASHVIPGIYAIAISKCSQVLIQMRYTFLKVCLFCVYLRFYRQWLKSKI